MGGKWPLLSLSLAATADNAQVDGVKQYIDWAIGENFGVMDVNVPGYVTQEEVWKLPPMLAWKHKEEVQTDPFVAQDSDAFIPASPEQKLQEQVRKLVCYLWDNFLQLYAADEIFLMGVGYAYLGIKMLLINRGTLCRRLLLHPLGWQSY